MLSSIPCRLLSELRWVAISSVNKTGGMRRLRRSSSSPMELTVELMGSKPINPKVLAEREGFEPPIPVKVYTLSRRAPSATRPSLRAHSFHFHFIRERLASNFAAHLTELSPAQPPHPSLSG